MSHLLICGAAGYTNLGDDAILWGMVTQLRAALGDRPIKAAGGPHLPELAPRLGLATVSYDDRAELARAIEEADLVLLGGGGLLYDVGYHPSLARLLTEPADRQWLYELTRLAAAARAAGRPVMLYGVGVGPLVTEAARRTARFVAEQAEVITVRDQGSADLLAECGLARSRIHVASDPAIAVEPAAERGQAWLRHAGLVEADGPRVVVNLRPWFHAADSSEPMDRLIAHIGEVVRLLCDRLGASVALVPFQRLNDDDGPVLERVRAAAGSPRARVVDPPAAPPELAAALAQCHLVVGMRLHALVLALCAAVPFAALAYDPKVIAFAEAAGLGKHVHDVTALDSEAVFASCQALLEGQHGLAAALAQQRDRFRSEAALSAELATWVLEREEPAARPQPTPLLPRARTAAPRRVLMQIRADYQERPGGDTIQMTETRRQLEALGIAVEVSTERAPELTGYDLVHTFNLGRPEDPYHHCLNALAQDKPIVLSTVYADFGEMWEWADTDYWELPPPGEGLPQPRRAPPPDPVEARRRARDDELRQAVLDWTTVYLPNGQGEAESLHDRFRMDLTRTVLVPNGVSELFFSARPEPFVERYGVRDFVLCAGRVEKKKNQLGLVAALRGTGLPLVIVGQANPEAYRELCRRYADDRVLFLDHLPQDQLASAYAAARVHALPSWFETPGLSTLEAAAAGCNVVSTDRGLAREYLGELAWYCDPLQLDSIREAVLAAYEAPRSERLRELVRERYTWRQAAARTLEGYQLAVSLHAASGRSEREGKLLAATRQYADWQARVAADRQYEAERALAAKQELEASYRELEEWALGLQEQARRLEGRICELQDELRRVTSRRLYRWSARAAGAAHALLRALRVRQ